MQRTLMFACVVAMAFVTMTICDSAVAMKLKVLEQTTHQLHVTETDGTPVADGPYAVMFSLWDDPVTGTLLWSESQTVITSNGLADVQLGAVVPLPIDEFASLDHDSSFVPYLQTEFDGEILTPRVRLTAVPYARAAERLSGDFFTEQGVLVTALGTSLQGKFESIATKVEDAKGSGGIIVDTGGVSLLLNSETPTGTKGHVLLSTGTYSGTPFDGPIGLSVESGSITGSDTSRAELGVDDEGASGRITFGDGLKQSSVGWYAGPDSAGDSIVTRDAATGRASGKRQYSAGTFSKSSWDVFENSPTKQAGKRLTKAEIISELSGTGLYLEEDEDTAIVVHASSDKRKQSLYFPESFLVGIGLEVETTSSKLYVGNLDFSSGVVDTGVVLDGSGDVRVNGQLDLSNSAGALIVPQLTTSERDGLSAVNGMIIYNTDHNAFNFFENGAWFQKQNVVTR